MFKEQNNGFCKQRFSYLDCLLRVFAMPPNAGLGLIENYVLSSKNGAERLGSFIYVETIDGKNTHVLSVVNPSLTQVNSIQSLTLEVNCKSPHDISASTLFHYEYWM